MRIPPNEVGLPLVEAVQAVHGRRIHLSTALRWCQSRNRFGVKLESWLQGGRRVTSVEAVRRYDERNTLASDAEHGVPVATTAQRARAHSQAVRELDAEFA